LTDQCKLTYFNSITNKPLSIGKMQRTKQSHTQQQREIILVINDLC
jgi:hypothetical protein